MRNQIASIVINQSEETYLLAPKSLYKGEPLWAQPGFEPGTSCTRSRNHTTRPLSHAWQVWPTGLVISKIMILIIVALGNLTSSPFCTGNLSSKERMQFFIHGKLWILFQVPYAAALFAVFVDFVNSTRFHKYPGFVYAYTLALVHCITATLGSLTHRLQRMLRRSAIWGEIILTKNNLWLGQ